MKTFKFSLVLRTRENTDVFISLDDNIYGIHSKRINILYIHSKHLNILYIVNYGETFYGRHTARTPAVMKINSKMALNLFVNLFKRHRN